MAAAAKDGPPPPQQQQQQQQQQEQPRAPASPANSALDNLQAMMNMVLIQSGRYLREQHQGHGSGRAALQLKHFYPIAVDRFNSSLDELENELHRAQAVIRRDLALLQADRLKREREAAAERQRIADAKKNVTAKKEESSARASEPKTQPEPSTRDTQSPEIKGQSARNGTDHAPPPIDTVMTTPAPERDPLFDGTPTTANPQGSEPDFDIMFGDVAMDTSGDNAGGQGDIDMDTTAPDLDFNLGDSGPSLLPGLEDFAKGGDATTTAQTETNLGLDFAMPDLPDISADQPTEQPRTSKPTDTRAATQQPTEDGEANLLDMPPDNLDSLFDLGDYENPENTEFANAFFGFDD